MEEAPQKKHHINAEGVAKGIVVRNRELTLKQKLAVSEYVRTGNKTASYRAAYNAKPKNAYMMANKLFKQPKIVNALDKALKDNKFSDDYAVKTLKKIVDGGMENIDIARPDTALKALETYFKITNKMGGGNKVAIKLDLESQAKKMDITELKKGLKELDKRQKRLLSIMNGTGRAEEGEVVE